MWGMFRGGGLWLAGGLFQACTARVWAYASECECMDIQYVCISTLATSVLGSVPVGEHAHVRGFHNCYLPYGALHLIAVTRIALIKMLWASVISERFKSFSDLLLPKGCSVLLCVMARLYFQTDQSHLECIVQVCFSSLHINVSKNIYCMHSSF